MSGIQPMSANTHERHRLLLASGAQGWLTLLIFLASIIVIGILMLPGGLNPIPFIIASFLLFMGYFITLILPLDAARRKIPSSQIAGFISRYRDGGVVQSTKLFSRVLLEAFFMNCRTLFAGFALFFSIDILIVLLKLAGGSFPLPAAGTVLFQSVAIIIFYFLVWKLEPYSMGFLEDVKGVRQHLIRRRFPEAVISVLFWLGAALALISVFLVIIMLPGFTVSSILSLSKLEQLRALFLSIGILLVCQYFIFRYIHGITSQDLLARFPPNAALHPSGLDEKSPLMQVPEAVEELLPALPCDEFHEVPVFLQGSKIYRIERKTIFGIFPVYIVNPDLSVILEGRTGSPLTARLGDMKKG